jgi:hypothetical protein
MRFGQLLSIFFLSIYSYSQLQSLIVIGDYIIDYQSYRHEKCENKDRPELKCNGTCQLAKLLASPVKSAPELGTVILFQTQVYLSLSAVIAFPLNAVSNNYFPQRNYNLLAGALKNTSPPPKIEILACLV